jgi:hypothetical protein
MISKSCCHRPWAIPRPGTDWSALGYPGLAEFCDLQHRGRIKIDGLYRPSCLVRQNGPSATSWVHLLQLTFGAKR